MFWPFNKKKFLGPVVPKIKTHKSIYGNSFYVRQGTKIINIDNESGLVYYQGHYPPITITKQTCPACMGRHYEHNVCTYCKM